MKIKFNVKGTERKKLVNEIADITNTDSKYLGVPTFAYIVDGIIIDREGTIVIEDGAVDETHVLTLINELERRGYKAENSPFEDLSKEEIKDEHSEDLGLKVTVPIECLKVTNLQHLLEIKGDLIKKALGIDDLTIDVTEYAVTFPWFDSSLDTETIQVYTGFISRLCKMSKEQTRINATDKKPVNEKYAFRCFLLRLGYIGDEYKTDRKILLKNLTGSSAFRTGAKKEVLQDVHS